MTAKVKLLTMSYTYFTNNRYKGGNLELTT